MSHQTGIRANEQLRIFFGKCRDGNVRLIKIAIRDEELCLDQYREPAGTWEEDYDRLVLPLLDKEQPCFILYRMDTTDADIGYRWILIFWSPDDSPVREKMLYASTKATLKLEFGGGQIGEEIFGSTKEDVSLRGYGKHKLAAEAPSPLTPGEEELERIKKNQDYPDFNVNAMPDLGKGLAFPISDDCIRALFEFRDARLDYVRMSIDLAKEEINLEGTTATDVTQLPKRISKNHPRYHLFRFPHTHEGDYMESTFFIYSMPGYNVSVKERMVYASCKAQLLEVIDDRVGIQVDKRLEISDGEELTKDFLLEKLHPPVNVHRPKFAKPKGPQNRGARRVTKGTDGGSLV